MKIVHLFCIVLFALTFQAGEAERGPYYRSCSSHNDCDKIVDTVFMNWFEKLKEHFGYQHFGYQDAKIGPFDGPKDLIESFCAVDAQKNGRCRFVYKPDFFPLDVPVHFWKTNHQSGIWNDGPPSESSSMLWLSYRFKEFTVLCTKIPISNNKSCICKYTCKHSKAWMRLLTLKQCNLIG